VSEILDTILASLCEIVIHRCQ